jgi:hypothetical protein
MTIQNTNEVIDSRDIIDRIEELSKIQIAIFNEQQSIEGDDDLCIEEEDIDSKHFRQWLQEGQGIEPDRDELIDLLALKDECENVSDWKYGETLIHSSYWVDYVYDLLRDCGDLPKDIPHYIEIDWDATANNIEQDYMRVDFGGEEYLIRNC